MTFEDGYVVLDNHGIKSWYKNGKLHRDGDLPASIIEPEPGKFWKFWYKNGVKHRGNDLPALISNDLQQWCKFGMLHRDGGKPAVIYADGKEEYWIDGVRQDEETDPMLNAFRRFLIEIED